MPGDPLKALRKATSIRAARPEVVDYTQPPPPLPFEEPEPLARFGNILDVIRGVVDSPIGALASFMPGGAATPPKRFPKFILPDGKVLDYTPAKIVRSVSGRGKVVDTTTRHGRLVEGKEAERALAEPQPSLSSRLRAEPAPPTVSSVEELANLGHRPAVTGEPQGPKPLISTWDRARRIGTSKLNEQSVREIRAALDEGQSVEAVAAKFGVKKPAIQAIKQRSSWIWVK